MPNRRVPRQAPPIAFSSASAPARPASKKAPTKALARREVIEATEILPAIKPLTRSQAEKLTAEIRNRTIQLWHLVARAHEGRAFEVLGYNTWKEYAERELNMSESRSFQLLDQAKVMRELAAAGAEPSEIDPPPARIVQAIKNDLDGVREYAREALARGEDLTAAIRAYALALEAERAQPRAPRKSAAKAVACPACGGHGTMTASQANALRRRLA